ncbi:unnamed protein product [Mesocestoides corti]|uniref:Uncharacterized protein n=1 Tax=Mesocestoides corti TaxID=53468 RepID=A0A0R3U9Y9_MESCO|nr:unnamed protein product [Mesocestoides corti]
MSPVGVDKAVVDAAESLENRFLPARRKSRGVEVQTGLITTSVSGTGGHHSGPPVRGFRVSHIAAKEAIASRCSLLGLAFRPHTGLWPYGIYGLTRRGCKVLLFDVALTSHLAFHLATPKAFCRLRATELDLLVRVLTIRFLVPALAIRGDGAQMERGAELPKSTVKDVAIRSLLFDDETVA